MSKSCPRWCSDDDVVDAEEDDEESDDECSDDSEGVGDSDSSAKH